MTLSYLDNKEKEKLCACSNSSLSIFHLWLVERMNAEPSEYRISQVSQSIPKEFKGETTLSHSNHHRGRVIQELTEEMVNLRSQIDGGITWASNNYPTQKFCS